MLVIDELAGFCDALTLSIAEYIVLQAERLLINLLEYREEQRIFLLALFEVFYGGVARLVVLIHVPFLELFVILHPLNKVVGL